MPANQNGHSMRWLACRRRSRIYPAIAAPINWPRSMNAPFKKTASQFRCPRLRSGALRLKLIREKLLRRCNLCAYCGKRLHPGNATLDHRTPTSRGGSMFNERNLTLACEGCNQEKGNKTEKEYRKCSGKMQRHRSRPPSNPVEGGRQAQFTSSANMFVPTEVPGPLGR
jgi:5-methylcytosine-specific restriction endonuclease McrA